jgi:hypothetical protein
MPQRKRHTLGWIGITALVCATSACAPEPTTPADTSLAGTWTANANLYTLSNFKMVMIQEPQGIVSGTWSARGTGGGGGCPVATPCDATGNLIGRNTVALVEIELLGAGKFEGVLIEPDRLRGIFSVGEAYDTITFRKFSNAVSTRVTQ